MPGVDGRRDGLKTIYVLEGDSHWHRLPRELPAAVGDGEPTTVFIPLDVDYACGNRN